MAALKFSTINVAGLRDEIKRKSIFRSLENSDLNVIALQETHCDKESKKKWKKEWTGKSVWTNYSSAEAGVAFLFSKNTDVNIIDEETDNKGRILRVTVEINNCKFQMLNFYGINPTNLQQSNYLFSQLTQYLDTELPPLLFGDFNMVENLEMDRKGGTPRITHTFGSKPLQELKEEFQLTDIWRERNPNKKQYTWHCPYENIHSRLDRIYIPAAWTPMVSNTYIENFVWSDHDMCVTKLSLPNAIKKGKGYWKLNLQFLEHERYKNIITEFWNEWKQKKEEYEDIQIWWDLGKIYTKSLSIQYAQEIFTLKRDKKAKLIEELNFEREQTEIDIEKIEAINKQLKEMENEKNQKMFIHTHTVVREENEEPTKYFYDLLKSRQNKATMSELQNEEGKRETNQTEIMNETKKFYSKLYTAENEVSMEDQNFFLQNINKGLTHGQKQQLDKDLQLEELEKALQDCKDEKTAGYDGLPYEFYKTFWNLLSEDFFQVANYSLNEIKELTFSQRYSLLTLIYKKGEKWLLLNWRPLSLLCCDYKIITKALTKRLSKVLDTIISKTQTASVPGRTMFQNLIFIRDILYHCERKNYNAYIISIDQEKAFDKVNRDFLYRILEKMNFGQKFITWIKALYANNKIHIFLNGYISIPFDNDRGLKQGDPLSALLYSIYSEPLTLAIKSDPNIHGIPMPGPEKEVIMQYSDDTNFFLDQKTQINTVFQVLRKFERATGSTINESKTTGLVIGKANYNDPFFHTIRWKNYEGLKILGITFFTDFLRTQNFNWTHRIEKLQIDLQNFQRRKLSLKGKVLVLNTVAMAKFWHTATVIPLPPWLEKKVNAMIFDFLWDGQNINPIERKTVFQPKHKGGLGLKNPKTQQIALQMKIIVHIIDKTTPNWIKLAKYWLGFHLAPLENGAI